MTAPTRNQNCDTGDAAEGYDTCVGYDGYDEFGRFDECDSNDVADAYDVFCDAVTAKCKWKHVQAESDCQMRRPEPTARALGQP